MIRGLHLFAVCERACALYCAPNDVPSILPLSAKLHVSLDDTIEQGALDEGRLDIFEPRKAYSLALKHTVFVLDRCGRRHRLFGGRHLSIEFGAQRAVGDHWSLS